MVSGGEFVSTMASPSSAEAGSFGARLPTVGRYALVVSIDKLGEVSGEVCTSSGELFFNSIALGFIATRVSGKLKSGCGPGTILLLTGSTFSSVVDGAELVRSIGNLS